MNWYKKALTFPPNKTLNENPNLWWEALRLKDGTIIYGEHGNHLGLYWHYYRRIGNIQNIESIGLLGGDGVYQVKLKGREAWDYLNPNWKTIKSAQEIIEQTQEAFPNYLDIGHDYYSYDRPLSEANYLWVLNKGEIIAKKEKSGMEVHEELFPDVNFGTTYSGRYEPHTGILSLLKPMRGPLELSQVPTFLINKLKEKFRNITKIYTYE